MDDPEQNLINVARRWKRGRAVQDRLDAERDEAIRVAREAGIPQATVMAITGLSRPRINQIMRNSRV